MEYQVQDEQFIEVKSPIDRLRDQWKATDGPVGFVRQIKLLQQNPELIQYAEFARLRGWSQPLLFVAQGVLLGAVLLTGLNWMLTKDKGKQAEEIAAIKADVETELKRQDGIIEAAQWEIGRIRKSSKASGFTVATSGPTLTRDAAIERLNDMIEQAHKSEEEYKARAALKEKQLHAAGDALALANTGTPLILALALVFAAQVFRRSAYRSYPGYKLVRQVDNLYLYYLAARGFWIVPAVMVLLHGALSANSYGLGGLVESLGPIGWVVFWLGTYAGLIYMFFLISKDLYPAMQIPAPRNLADFGNKLLMRMNSSFLLVFAAMEAVFLGLCYGTYLLALH